MLRNITFKTELSDLITHEEVSILFDSISLRYASSLVALSLYPKFIKLKKETLETTTEQRNNELSCLLSAYNDRKQELKQEMSNHLNKLNESKKHLKPNKSTEEIEQSIYEEEQIIKTYEDMISSIAKKEKKILSGKYQRINKIALLSKTNSLKRQLEELKKKILIISANHNNCFEKHIQQINDLINGSILTIKHIVPVFDNTTIKIEFPKKFSGIFENIECVIDDECKNLYYEINDFSKDFYLYEPNKSNFDDELIYQLLSSINYDSEDGSVNAIEITSEIDIEEE